MKRNEKIRNTIITIAMIGIIGLLLLPGAATTAETVHNMNTGINYTSIQASIDAASIGDTIHVDSGIYNENLEVNKDGLTLKGIDTGGGKPVVNANGVGNGINITAKNVTIDGFAVTGSASDGGGSAGIFVTSNSYMEKNYVVIKNNDVSNNGGNGIYLYHANENEITDNTVNSNSAEGILLYSSSNNLLSNNIAHGNNWAGIYAGESSSVNTIINNTASNNSFGIQLSYTDNYNTVTDNILTHNINNGLYIINSHYNVLTNNTVGSNGYGIVIILGEGNKIYHNNFVSNSFNVDDKTGDKNIWNDTYPSGGNYWSDYNGVDLNSGINQDQSGNDGIGDTSFPISCGNFVSCGEGSEDHYPLITPYAETPTPPSTQVIIPYLDIGYRYKVVATGEGTGFESPSFDDSGFSVGDAGFGKLPGYCSLNTPTYTKTPWPLYSDILLRKEFSLPSGATNLKVGVAVDNDVQVFINGYDISGGLKLHEDCATRDSFVFTAPDSILKTGNNLIAVLARDRGDQSYIDVQITADTVTIPPPTPTPTPIPPTPLTVSIISPANNNYSEELVNFSGTVSGGTPPYTYTWADTSGTLRTISTISTADEFSKEYEFNKEPEMNKHSVSLTVQDSTGNPATQTTEFTVVKQIIKILVVPVTEKSEFGKEYNSGIIDDAIKEVRKYYFDSSYSAIYLEIERYKEDIPLNQECDHENKEIDCRDPAIKNTLDKLFADPSFKDSEYNTIIIADVDLSGGGTDTLNVIRDLTDRPKLSATVAVVSAKDDTSVGAWKHEIGHTLGYTVKTAYGIYKNPDAMLWADKITKQCCDLYDYGNVEAWDIMALGQFVWNNDKGEVNQPMNMSVLSKINLGWLSQKIVSESNEDYPIMSTENMRYGDSSLVYRPAYSDNVEYNIEAREIVQPSYYKWNVKTSSGEPLFPWGNSLNNGILIYKTIYDSDGYYSINIQRSWPLMPLSDATKGPTLLASDGTLAEYTDYIEFVTFKVTESNQNHPYNAKVKIGPCIVKCGLKAIITLSNPTFVIWDALSPFNSPDFNATYPDLDLHAYTPDGLHVGINRTNGLYEVQIPGAVASGDQNGGQEWIVVPVGTQVRYEVDSYDVQQYLAEHPEIDPANATMNYTISFMEYGNNPQLVQLPDGNWTVTNRTVSVPVESIIGPGSTKEVLAYNLSFSPNNKKTAKSGSAAPIKFNITDWNGKIVDKAIASVYVVSGGSEINATSKGKANIGNLAKFNATEQQYGYILDTSPLPLGLTTIRIRLNDGTMWETQIEIK